MNFKEMYKQKLTTAEEAVKLVQDGLECSVPDCDWTTASFNERLGQAQK